MPTAPKLVAALWFALLAWFSAELVKAYLPEGTQFGLMSVIAGGFGGLTGWIFLGRRAGDTMKAALTYGFSASVILSFWSIFYFAFETMLHRSIDGRYKGAMHALVSMVDLGKDYAIIVLTAPDVMGALIIGGLFGGWLTEKAAERWA